MSGTTRVFTMVDSDVEAAKLRMRASGETEENISYEATCNAIKFAAKHGIRRVSGKGVPIFWLSLHIAG